MQSEPARVCIGGMDMVAGKAGGDGAGAARFGFTDATLESPHAQDIADKRRDPGDIHCIGSGCQLRRRSR